MPTHVICCKANISMFISVVFSLIVIALPPFSQALESTRVVYIDTHNHMVGKWSMGQFDFAQQERNSLETMDRSGVKLSLLMPMPQTVNQRMLLKAEDLFPTAKKYPGRFAVLGGGGSLNILIQQAVKKGRVTTAMEKKFDARVLELVQKGVVGFGEMTAEHFSMTKEHPYESAPPDHPLFLRLADLAAKYDLPIDIHMEAIAEEMAMPRRFKSPPNPQTLKPNIDAFSRFLAHNRRAKIIWVHLGWDNTGQRTVALTRKLLIENPNLYFSVRIASGMKKRRVSIATFPLDTNGRLKSEWLSMFQEFPDRFILGSDEIVKPANDHPSAGSIHSTLGILGQLPSQLKSQIGYKNAYFLFKLKE
ncbi:MAG TPA: amidohydrolase family protein [Nitrospinota bacterium]|nr:amidohydrolase family protein [Nitrospinota bacterium]